MSHPKRSRQTPLAYLLSVVRDPDADPARRDKCAIAAAPYVHARPGDLGKKAKADEAARTASRGTAWGADLHFDGKGERQDGAHDGGWGADLLVDGRTRQ